jgi:hypothetical protein
MNDSAEGAISGFLFQFEKALLMLAALTNSDESISVENVDDIAKHDSPDSGKVLSTTQAKHSLSATGTAFADTSEALWRTIEIWVLKLDDGTFNDATEFICSTNKVIPPDALVRKLQRLDFKEAKKQLTELVESLEAKEVERQEKDKSTTTLTKIIAKIRYALKHETHLNTVFKNLKIEDAENVKPKFLEMLRLTSGDVNVTRQDEIYATYYGWLMQTCYAKWKNGEKAIITKRMFDQKWSVVNSSPQLINAIFRKKEALGTLSEEKKVEIRDELFFRQINDIERGPGKKVILEKAISDFIHHEIEMSHVIGKGEFTINDFNQFRIKCSQRWQELFYQSVTQDDHTETEMNEVAIKVYDAVMNEMQLHFTGGFQFDLDSRYIKNGAFLKLSNKPEIGWRPDWSTKYGNDDRG